MSLAATVASLCPGQKVRASLRHLERPVVGVLRVAQNSVFREGESLFLDVPAAHMIRDHAGLPGWGLRWVEVLPAGGTEREEELEHIDALVDEYLIAKSAWEQAPAADRADAREAARAAYAACVLAMNAPFEVTA